MGPERQVVVAALGLLLAAIVHPADVQDRDGARLVFSDLAGRLPQSEAGADGSCAGQLVGGVLSS